MRVSQGIKGNIFRLCRVLIVVIFFTGLVHAAEISHPSGKTFLWEVKSESNSIYILGSIHAFRKELYPLNDTINKAFDTSDILAVEVDITKIDQAALQSSIFESSMFTDGKTLSSVLSRETYELAEKRLGEYGLPIQQFEMFKPSFIALTITTMELMRQGFNPDLGIDRHFLLKASKDKEIVELESFNFQFKILSTFSGREQELFLVSTLKDMEIMASELNSLVTAWQTGDTNSVESILFKNLTDNPEFGPVYDRILFSRNATMLSKIEEYLRSGKKYFVVVGAGHLVGDRGIIRQLMSRGYTVRQL